MARQPNIGTPSMDNDRYAPEVINIIKQKDFSMTLGFARITWEKRQGHGFQNRNHMQRLGLNLGAVNTCEGD